MMANDVTIARARKAPTMLRVCVVVCCLLVSAACAASRRPVIRAAPTAIKTGNHVVVLRRNTTAETLHHFLARAAKLSDDAKVHRYVETVAKAFTIKLSPYSLEVVS